MKKNESQTDKNTYGLDRREFLKTAGITAGALLLIKIMPLSFSNRAIASVQVPQTPLPGKGIPKYVDWLPHFAGVRVTSSNLAVDMLEFQQYVLPEAFHKGLFPIGSTDPLTNGTWVWGYKINGNGPLYPGFTVEATRGTPNTMTYLNNVPTSNSNVQKYITIDQTLHWADPLMLMPSMDPYTGPPPLVTHLHGGEVPSDFDGGPDQWFTPNGIKGLGYRSDKDTPIPSNGAVYIYPNAQEPATLWFHDHALGATRANVYAGLAAFYFLRDWGLERPDLPGGPSDTTVIDNSDPNNPKVIKPEIEIVIQDRMFDNQGQLLFPDGSDPALDVPPNPTVHPYWIPEFLGDVIVVNGKTWPYLNVEPRRYRLRFLNGSNARFYRMRLEDMVLGAPGPAFWQIGTDGGLLDTPVELNPFDPVMPQFLLLAPGERADIIIDFSGFAGKTLTLRNNARAPFPKGAPPHPQTVGQIMQFRVQNFPLSGGPDNSYDPTTLAPPRTTLIGSPTTGGNRLVDPATGTLATGVTPDPYRQLTLNEVMGPGGPLEVLVNNTKWSGKREKSDGSGDMEPIPGFIPDGQGNYLSELPNNGSIEVWEVINLTADAHPIHLHLVQFQLLNRQNFNVNKYSKAYANAFPGGGWDHVNMQSYPPKVFIPAFGPPMSYNVNQTPNVIPAKTTIGGNPDVTPHLQGAVRPPEPNEAGWKDTVIMYPGQVTRIVVRFKAQDGTPFPFDPTGNTQYAKDKNGLLANGPGYVWHCHIIDHEDNEMMRPYHPVP